MLVFTSTPLHTLHGARGWGRGHGGLKRALLIPLIHFAFFSLLLRLTPLTVFPPLFALSSERLQTLASRRRQTGHQGHDLMSRHGISPGEGPCVDKISGLAFISEVAYYMGLRRIPCEGCPLIQPGQGLELRKKKISTCIYMYICIYKNAKPTSYCRRERGLCGLSLLLLFLFAV